MVKYGISEEDDLKGLLGDKSVRTSDLTGNVGGPDGAKLRGFVEVATPRVGKQGSSDFKGAVVSLGTKGVALNPLCS